jgi:hypothetical protein
VHCHALLSTESSGSGCWRITLAHYKSRSEGVKVLLHQTSSPNSS